MEVILLFVKAKTAIILVIGHGKTINHFAKVYYQSLIFIIYAIKMLGLNLFSTSVKIDLYSTLYYSFAKMCEKNNTSWQWSLSL